MPDENSIFVSYRRSDSNDITGRIYDRLADYFGSKAVFRDVHSIPLGVDFRSHLQQQVGNCKVLVAVIGPTWLAVADQSGNRRLDVPSDWVKAEIETALNRDIPVIPVLVGGATMPKAEGVPGDLKPLAYRNGISARPYTDFRQDMHRLIRRLEEIVGEPPMDLLNLNHRQRAELKANTTFDRFLKIYQVYPEATECLAKDQDALLTFFDFPTEHWAHVCITNLIESTFATVRLRTGKTRGCVSKDTILALVFKLVQSAGKTRLRIRGFKYLAGVVEGVPFKDGLCIEEDTQLNGQEQGAA